MTKKQCVPLLFFLTCFLARPVFGSRCNKYEKRWSCNRRRRWRSCRWLYTNDSCVHEDDYDCDDLLLDHRRTCRKFKKCTWDFTSNECRSKEEDREEEYPNKCALVRCGMPLCRHGTYTVEGECCPTCKAPPVPEKCAYESCLIPKCSEGQEQFTPDGECCPKCRDTESGDCPEPEEGRCSDTRVPLKCGECLYDNKCLAELAGFDLWSQCEPAEQECSTHGDCDGSHPQLCHEGTCRQMCGGFAGYTCKSNLKCHYDEDDSCNPKTGGADCAGVCVDDSEYNADVDDPSEIDEEDCPKPRAGVNCITLYDPMMCGNCEYSNSCVARAAGYAERSCVKAGGI